MCASLTVSGLPVPPYLVNDLPGRPAIRARRLHDDLRAGRGLRGAARSARLRVLVCTKQTGAVSNAAWQASPLKTVTSWTACTARDPVGSAW
jgi:hypothetical protein